MCSRMVIADRGHIEVHFFQIRNSPKGRTRRLNAVNRATTEANPLLVREISRSTEMAPSGGDGCSFA